MLGWSLSAVSPLWVDVIVGFSGVFVDSMACFGEGWLWGLIFGDLDLGGYFTVLRSIVKSS